MATCTNKHQLTLPTDPYNFESSTNDFSTLHLCFPLSLSLQIVHIRQREAAFQIEQFLCRPSNPFHPIFMSLASRLNPRNILNTKERLSAVKDFTAQSRCPSKKHSSFKNFTARCTPPRKLSPNEVGS